MSPTVYDIAEASGYSQPTVSQILSGKGDRYRKQTAEHVLNTAAALGYRPNSAARSTSTGKFGCISLLIGTRTSHSEIPQGLLDGISDVLQEANINLMITRTPEEKLTDPVQVPRLLRESCCDGFLVDYTHDIPAAMRELVDEADVPAVWLNTKAGCESVYPDDYQAAVQAVEHLIGLGHRRIAYFNYRDVTTKSHYSEVDRLQGYTDAMVNAGLNPEAPQQVKSRRYDWVNWWSQRLRSADRPTAVVGYSGKPLMQIQRAADRVGLDVPRNISLMGFDVEPIYLGREATTMLVPTVEVGRRACQQLIDMGTPHTGDSKTQTCSAIPFNLFSGKTTAAPLL